MIVKSKREMFSPMFAVLVPSKVVGVLAQMVPPTRHLKGQILFYRDHLPYGIYVIHSGKVNLEKSGRKKNIMVLGSGFALGISLLNKNMPYPYTGRIAEDSEISFLNRTLLKQLEGNGDLISKELKNLGGNAGYGQIFQSLQNGPKAVGKFRRTSS